MLIGLRLTGFALFVNDCILFPCCWLPFAGCKEIEYSKTYNQQPVTYFFNNNITTAVMTILIKASGINPFHPRFIN